MHAAGTNDATACYAGLMWLMLLLSCSDATKPKEKSAEPTVGESADADDYTVEEGDCDDANALVYPGAEETCDGLDNDCDGQVDEYVSVTFYTDADEDGFGDPTTARVACEADDGEVVHGEDCDDTRDDVFPGAEEWCDGVDDDCDGEVDEDDAIPLYADADGDGAGDPTATISSCYEVEGYVANDDDCDDATERAAPDRAEVCDEIDNNCDGVVDEGVTTPWYEDRDADGYGVDGATEDACVSPTGYTGLGGDCDDADAAYNPGATEACTDTLDYNCDGSIGYADVDVDGFAACLECDDADAAVNPLATEVCNGIDDDCDGDVDDADASLDAGTRTEWYLDTDGDGFGDLGTTTSSCAAPAGYVANSADCDDADTTRSPAATEVCDGIDNDCNGQIDDDDAGRDASTTSNWYPDSDTDGFGDASVVVAACVQPAGFVADATDCDDYAAAVNPAASEVCNGIDDDCDAAMDDDDGSLDVSTATAWSYDGDADGYGAGGATLSCLAPADSVANDEDCDDLTPAVNPMASEVCNGIDDDCDGAADDDDGSLDTSTGTAVYYDGDADGYGGGALTAFCVPPAAYVVSGSDCDDATYAVNPAATEVCDGVDNDCSGTIDDGMTTVTSSVYATSPGPSCNGNYDYAVTFTSCGCSDVTLAGSFSDNSDGSSGQVVGVGTSASSISLTWDDCSSGCDCDLDIAATTSWSASRAGSTLTISVSNSITGYDAGNNVSAGYSITGYGDYRDHSGSSSGTFTYSCP